MAQRTLNLYGKVWGDPASPASITVSFDGQQRYQGPVATSIGSVDKQTAFVDMDVLATWQLELDDVGPKDLTFTITGGNAIFHVIHANYNGEQVLSWKFTPGATWPAYQPSSADEVAQDMQQLDSAAFDEKYGMGKTPASAQIEPDQVLPTDQNYSDITGPSTPESDGYNNVQIDGVPQTRPEGAPEGKWIDAVLDGQSLICQVQVTAAVI